MITIKIGRDTDEVDQPDPIGRTRMGWNPGITENEVWARSRGMWIIAEHRVVPGDFAVVTDYTGTIRAVAQIATSRVYGLKRALIGDLLEGHHLVGKPTLWPNKVQRSVLYPTYPPFPANSLSVDGLIDEVEDLIRGRDFPRGLSADQRRAVEKRGMDVVRDSYPGWEITDVSKTMSFDLLCCRGKQELWIEVKGTTGGPQQVLVTYNEVALSTENPDRSVLAIVHGIKLDKKAKPPIATGGELIQIRPWKPASKDLKPIAYRYTVPS